MPSFPTVTITIEGDDPHLAELLEALVAIRAKTTPTTNVAPAPAPEPPTDLLAMIDSALELELDAGTAEGGRQFRGRKYDQYPRPYIPKDLRVTGWAMMRHHELGTAAKARRTTTDLVLFVLDNLARLTGTTGRFRWSNVQLGEILGIKASHVSNATAVLTALGALERADGHTGGRVNLDVNV